MLYYVIKYLEIGNYAVFNQDQLERQLEYVDIPLEIVGEPFASYPNALRKLFEITLTNEQTDLVNDSEVIRTRDQAQQALIAYQSQLDLDKTLKMTMYELRNPEGFDIGYDDHYVGWIAIARTPREALLLALSECYTSEIGRVSDMVVTPLDMSRPRIAMANFLVMG